MNHVSIGLLVIKLSLDNLTNLNRTKRTDLATDNRLSKRTLVKEKHERAILGLKKCHVRHEKHE